MITASPSLMIASLGCAALVFEVLFDLPLLRLVPLGIGVFGATICYRNDSLLEAGLYGLCSAACIWAYFQPLKFWGRWERFRVYIPALATFIALVVYYIAR